MPIYVYRCSRCSREVEELQKFSDPAPITEEPCGEDPAQTCDLHRAPTTFTQRWVGDYSSEGRGGWQRQGEAMVRQVPGANTTTYGDGSV